MKRTIEGIVYDTETAKLLSVAAYDRELTERWTVELDPMPEDDEWIQTERLYRCDEDDYFLVIKDPFGNIGFSVEWTIEDANEYLNSLST